MRHFNQLLFFGAGEEALLKMAKLDLVYKNAIGAANLQQMISTKDPAAIEAKKEAEDAVRDIAAALLGRRITIGAKLPYPARKKNENTRQP